MNSLDAPLHAEYAKTKYNIQGEIIATQFRSKVIVGACLEGRD